MYVILQVLTAGVSVAFRGIKRVCPDPVVSDNRLVFCVSLRAEDESR